MSEREIFNEWIKHYEKHDVKIDQLQRAFMWQSWQASANREGYKLAPVEPTQEMISAGMGVFSFPLDNGRFSDCELIFSYREMIGACDDH